MVLLGGASETGQEGLGAFQEWPQLESVRACVKYAARPASVDLIPRHLERAVRTSVYGRPGPTYIDLPGDLLNTRVPENSVELLGAWRPLVALEDHLTLAVLVALTALLLLMLPPSL